MKAIRVISAVLTLAQLGWAAALLAIGSPPTWALVTASVLGALGTAAPGVLEQAIRPPCPGHPPQGDEVTGPDDRRQLVLGALLLWLAIAALCCHQGGCNPYEAA